MDQTLVSPFSARMGQDSRDENTNLDVRISASARMLILIDFVHPTPQEGFFLQP
jgi:hypothetical protein